MSRGGRWELLELSPDVVVPFKKETYLRVVKAFSGFVEVGSKINRRQTRTLAASPP